MEGVDAGADLGGLLTYGGGGQAELMVIIADVESDELGEVEVGGGASEVEDGGVVGASGGDGGRVRAEPNPRPLVGLPYLSHPFPPLPHPYASVCLVIITLTLPLPFTMLLTHLGDHFLFFLLNLKKTLMVGLVQERLIYMPVRFINF